MKKILIILLSLNYYLSPAQKVLDTTFIDIPYIGENGGAHLLNWSLNNDKSEIYLYAYSHINGSQIVTNPKEIREAKDKHNEKSFFGKMLSTVARDNVYEDTVIPIVFEKKINANDFTSISSKKLLFHKVRNIPDGNNIYFKKSSGIVDLAFPFSTGQKLKYHYEDINIPFKYAPKYNKDILKSTYIELKGEGVLGLKNIKPVLISKRGFFTYDNNKGYISKTESNDIVDLSDNDSLKGYNFVQRSDQIFNKNYFAWFVKDKDFSKYKLVVADDKGNLTIKPFNFGAPRKLKIINEGVHDKDLGLKGVLNVFGYHKKGKKNKDLYPVNKFDVVYNNPNGDIVFNTKVDYGTEKEYKNVISPILVFENIDQQLEFINNHVSSVFKSNLERFILDKNGKTELISSKKYYEVKDDTRINYYDYLSNYDRVDKFGSFYIIRKIISSQIEVPVKNQNGTSSTQKEEADASINLTILDKNFSPVAFKSFSTNPNIIGKLYFQTIENNENEIVFLSRKKNLYYMVKIEQTSSIPKIEFSPIDLDYSKQPSPMLYFGAFTHNFALVHKKNRHIYLMNQYYDFKTYNAKIIDKVDIIKIEY